MHYYQNHQVWFWTYLQNWPLIFRDDVNANALNHYWSLAIEEQYYLVWPLIVLFIKKPKGIINNEEVMAKIQNWDQTGFYLRPNDHVDGPKV